jgi:hypothetical protein
VAVSDNQRAKGFPWWLVLALVGLDYFSTLAYLPSVALDAAGARRELAPLIGLGVVLVTLLAALPVYLYVVRRSPHGEGATGLLEQRVKGWLGKGLLLIVLGFVATDFVITRTLSVADASRHLTENPVWRENSQWVSGHREQVRQLLPGPLRGEFFDFWNEQLVVTVVLSMMAFAFYAWVFLGFTRWLLKLAFAIVGLYLALTVLIVVSGLVYLAGHPEMLGQWAGAVHPELRSFDSTRVLGPVLLLALLAFPQMALGLSGFELSMTTAPLVEGSPDDDPERPTTRVRNTRKLLVTAVLIMAPLVLGSILVVTLLVPEGVHGEHGPARYRALAWLAHGGELRGPAADDTINPLFGTLFGTLYDLSSVLILGLAGASATVGMRDLVPRYLARYGMQLEWARKIGVILHLFNCTILLVILVFQASVSAQLWAYATSVLVLLTAASCAAVLEVRRNWHGSAWRGLVQAPFTLIAGFFLAMTGLTLYQNRSGLVIALAFLGVVFATAFVSRWLRALELRFHGFRYASEYTRRRWEELRQLHFQVLVAHNPEHLKLEEKERLVRAKYRLAPEVPVLFIEAYLGDPSEFYHEPLLEIVEEKGREIIKLSQCASLPHAIAAVLLEFAQFGDPPEMLFDWSEESPLVANLRFLFWGQGNIPWLVHELVRRAVPDLARRPRVVVG